MDFEEGIRSINHILDRMPDVMEEQTKTVLEKSGTEIKKQVLRVMKGRLSLAIISWGKPCLPLKNRLIS